MRLRRMTSLLALVWLLSGVGPAAAQNGPRTQEGAKEFGVPVYPGAKSMSKTARAIEAYYRPSLQAGETIEAAVFETPASFQEVYDFYGPMMLSGKFGWRKKEHGTRHQIEGVKMFRRQLVARSEAKNGKLPEALEPLFGDSDLSQDEFEARAEKFVGDNPDAVIKIVEGSRLVEGAPAGSQVRITVESPYIDLGRMKIVNRTRIQFVKVEAS
jgi:hypothetical protein